MDRPLRLLFYIDEHLPARELKAILAARGHEVVPVQIGFKDPAILVTAEANGAIIVTADTSFLRELFRLPAGHRRRFVRARVVQVAGEWPAARQRLLDYLPVVEAVCLLRMQQQDQRVGIDLSHAQVRILEAAPRPGLP